MSNTLRPQVDEGELISFRGEAGEKRGAQVEEELRAQDGE